jgi:hypothetical protein
MWVKICAFALSTALFALIAAPVEAGASGAPIYHFKNIQDGYTPTGLVADREGNLFGTTPRGGNVSSCYPDGCGTVFELIPPAFRGGEWKKVTLHTFANNFSDGYYPASVLIVGDDGNIFGVTNFGGPNNAGTVFELSRPDKTGGQWTESLLYGFTYANHRIRGDVPGALLLCSGILYGSTFDGGVHGGGTVFELRPPRTKGGTWSESVIHDFDLNPGVDTPPGPGLAIDRRGNLYGTRGGDYSECLSNNPTNCGELYRLERPKGSGGQWPYEAIHQFYGWSGGSLPNPELSIDGRGNLFGTTGYGGIGGTVFELTPPATRGGMWSEYVLDDFLKYANDGNTPFGGVTIGPNGNLFGTTSTGGKYNAGLVFELVRPPSTGNWTEKVLFDLLGGADGSFPESRPVFGAGGDLYTTAASSGIGGCPGFGPKGCGVVFKIEP